MGTVVDKGTAVVTLPADTEILITREFDAPRHLVYRAWTTPELIKRWWGGDRGECAFRAETIRSSYANEEIVPDDDHIRHRIRRSKVDRDQPRVIRRRTKGFSVEHSRPRDVRWIVMCAGYDVMPGWPGNGCAQHLPLLHRSKRSRLNRYICRWDSGEMKIRRKLPRHIVVRFALVLRKNLR